MWRLNRKTLTVDIKCYVGGELRYKTFYFEAKYFVYPQLLTVWEGESVTNLSIKSLKTACLLFMSYK